MVKTFVEVCITGDLDSGELLEKLDDPHLLGAWEKDGEMSLYWPEERWRSETLERLRSATAIISREDVQRKITIREVPDQDWNLVWTKSIQPIRIGRRVMIRQSWNTAATFPGMIELVLDPSRAFGTGYHPTTQLAIDWLEQKIEGGERLLDCGTGSGILAMVALRLGAAYALGIDHDPIAIECALEYASLNGFGSALALRVTGVEEMEAQTFDLMTANLDRNTLVRIANPMSRLVGAGGALLVTGILHEDYGDVAAAFSQSGCLLSASTEREDWIALEITPARGK